MEEPEPFTQRKPQIPIPHHTPGHPEGGIHCEIQLPDFVQLLPGRPINFPLLCSWSLFIKLQLRGFQKQNCVTLQVNIMSRGQILILTVGEESRPRKQPMPWKERPSPQVSPLLNLLGNPGNCARFVEFLPPGQRVSSEPDAGMILNRDSVQCPTRSWRQGLNGIISIGGSCEGNRHSV